MYTYKCQIGLTMMYTLKVNLVGILEVCLQYYLVLVPWEHLENAFLETI